MSAITRTKTEELICTFTPQAWVNDYAIDVDPQGPTSYPVTVEMAAEWPPDWRTRELSEYEYIVKDTAPHEWIREYTGPFEFHLTWRESDGR